MIVLDAYGNVAPYLIPQGGYFMQPVHVFLVADDEGNVEVVYQVKPEPLQSAPWGVTQAIQQQ